MRESHNFENQSEFDFSNLKIPFLTGRPKRSQIIAVSDISNLKIALYTSKSLEDFFKSV